MRRLFATLPRLVAVLFLVTFFTFTLVRLLPGDPAVVVAPFATDKDTCKGAANYDPKGPLCTWDRIHKDIGYNEPFYTEYPKWLGKILTGDFGTYYASNDKVSARLSQSLPVSLELMATAQILALIFAIPLGVFTAHRAGSRFDRGTSTLAFGALAMPSFVLGLFLSYYVGVKWKIWDIPTQGFTRLTADFEKHVKTMILPTVTLAVGQIAIYMRLLRSDMIATLQENFIGTAKSKGISERRILFRHALRPSSLTLLTVAGLNVGSLIGGAVVVEIVFQLPGMGYNINQAILAREYVALQSYVAVIAVGYVAVNVLVDILYRVLDPRVRHAAALN